MWMTFAFVTRGENETLVTKLNLVLKWVWADGITVDGKNNWIENNMTVNIEKWSFTQLLLFTGKNKAQSAMIKMYMYENISPNND